MASDSSGNLYIADEANERIRRVDALTGTITTVAGGGSGGDGGPATSARLYDPYGVAVDSSGNIFIADTDNHLVRRVDASSGIITTVAGNGTMGYTGDGGRATSAELSYMYGVAVDESGNLFIADSGNLVVRRVDAATGVITTVAGKGNPGYSGDGGPATSATFGTITGVAVDASGNLYIADFGNSVIRRVDGSTGILSTIAGDGTIGYGGDGGSATLANLNRPWRVTVDASGHLYILDTGNGRVRQVLLAPMLKFSLASLSFGNYPVGSINATTPFSVTNSGSANMTILNIATSGDFSQTNDCPVSPATLNPGSSCKITVTLNPTAGGDRTGTLTVADTAYGSPHNLSLDGTGEDFTVVAASDSSTSQTVKAGGTATYSLSFAPQGGFAGSVALSCSGAPSLATCTVSPNPLTLSGTNAAIATVSLTTTASTTTPPRGPWDLPTAPSRLPHLWWLIFLSALLGISFSSKRRAAMNRVIARHAGSRARWQLAPAFAAASALLLALVWASCGGGGGGNIVVHNPGTPAGTYSLILKSTFSSGSTTITHNTTLTLTVN